MLKNEKQAPEQKMQQPAKTYAMNTRIDFSSLFSPSFFETISARGGAAKLTSAEVAQQNHPEEPACPLLTNRIRQAPGTSSGSVWSDGMIDPSDRIKSA